MVTVGLGYGPPRMGPKWWSGTLRIHPEHRGSHCGTCVITPAVYASRGSRELEGVSNACMMSTFCPKTGRLRDNAFGPRRTVRSRLRYYAGPLRPSRSSCDFKLNFNC